MKKHDVTNRNHGILIASIKFGDYLFPELFIIFAHIRVIYSEYRMLL